eukprot:5012465-Amphidinium_carterae.1
MEQARIRVEGRVHVPVHERSPVLDRVPACAGDNVEGSYLSMCYPQARDFGVHPGHKREASF